MRTLLPYSVGLGCSLLAFLVGYKVGPGKPRTSADLLPSYNNSMFCRGLPSGANIRDVVLKLGAPIGAKDDYLLFEQSPPFADRIKVKTVPLTGAVVELSCGDR